MPIPSVDLDRPHVPAQRWPRGAAPAVLLAAAATVAGGILLGRWLDDDALPWRAAALALGGSSLLLWLAATNR